MTSHGFKRISMSGGTHRYARSVVGDRFRIDDDRIGCRWTAWTHDGAWTENNQADSFPKAKAAALAWFAERDAERGISHGAGERTAEMEGGAEE